MLSLKVRDGERSGTVFRLGTRVLTLGRDHQNPVQLVDPEVSRRHALIRWTGATYLLRDLQSQNGTFVGGRPVEEKELRAGDLIRIGRTVLEVVPDDREAVDGVLGRKVVKGPVSATTMPSPDLEPVREGLVDLDAEAERRAMRLARVTASLRGALKAGRHRALVYKEAMAGVLDLLGADRVAIVSLGVNGRPAVEASAAAAEIENATSATDVDLAAIDAAARVKSGVIRDGARGTGADSVVPSAIAVVPALVDDRVVGFVYVDSLVTGGIQFLDEDLDLLVSVAKALASSFVAKKS